MEMFLFITIPILTVILLACALSMDNSSISKIVFIFILEILIIACSLFLGSKIDIPAIEVYRNNTKLEVTEKVVNGIVVERDSIVLYKK